MRISRRPSLAMPILLASSVIRCASEAARCLTLFVLAVAWSSPVFANPDIVLPSVQETRQATLPMEVDSLPRSISDVNLAIQSFETKNFEACIKHLDKAVKANPELPPPHALLAKLAFLSNQGTLIRPALERAIIEDREHPEVYILFANLALIEGRLSDASVHLEKSAALAASNRWTTEQRQRFERLCHQGNAMLAETRRDWEGARTALSEWLALEPANAKARRRLGIALFSLKKTTEASKELQQAAKEDTSMEAAPLTMGWLYSRQGDMKKAEEWMLYAVKVAPQSAPVQLGVASWMLEQGRSDEAKTHVDAAAKLEPKSKEVRRDLGLIALQKKDYAAAESIFQALTQESPGDAWSRNQLALALVEQPDVTKQRKALELAELSVHQDPNAPEALIGLGTVFYRMKRADDAEKVLQTVFNSGKANSDAVYVLAQIQVERNHPQAAQALLKSALSAPGLFVARKDAQQLLDSLAKQSK